MKRARFIVVVLILLGSFFLRLHNYTAYPQRGATSDEYTYAFLGVSLLTKGLPVSWSHFDYPNKTITTIDNIVFPIVSPYFDHPPFFGILVGGWAILFGQNIFEKIDLAVIRIVPIFLSFVTSILLVLTAQKIYSFKVAIWAVLIYTTATVFVMNNRVVVSETFLTPLLLGSVLLLFSKSKNVDTKKALFLGILAGLGILTKIAGIVIFLSILFLLILERVKQKPIFVICATFFLFVALLLGYAAFYDWNLFWHIQLSQGARHIGPQTIWLLINDATIVNKTIQDGWYFIGFLSLFYLFTDSQKHRFMIIPSFMYLLVLLATLTREGHSGWYMIPLFPFMAIAISYLLVENLNKKSWYVILFVLFIGLSQIGFIYEQAFGLTNVRYRILLGLLMGPFLLAILMKKKRWVEILGNAWFYLFILGNALLTYNYIHPL